MHIFYALLIVALYFLPAINAYENKKSNKQSVFVINLFLGWTVLGWIIALAMSAGKDKVVVVEKKSAHSTSTELEKLLELKEKGVLTDEEFEKQKQKILS